jgi:hypothetical protein
MGKSIYGLQSDYLELMHQIEELDGELTPELESELTINIDSFEDKMGSYTDLIDFLKSQLLMNKDKMNAMTTLNNTTNNLIDRLKGNMRDALQLYGDDGKSGNKTLDIGNHKYYTRKNEIVTIPNEETFLIQNDEYINVNVTEKFTKDELIELIHFVANMRSKELTDIAYKYSIDKRKLKADLKLAVEVDGAMLVRNDNIIIK